MTIITSLKNKIRKNWWNRNALIDPLTEAARNQFHEKNDYQHNFEGMKYANESGLVEKVANICFELAAANAPEEFFAKARKIKI